MVEATAGIDLGVATSIGEPRTDLVGIEYEGRESRLRKKTLERMSQAGILHFVNSLSEGRP